MRQLSFQPNIWAVNVVYRQKFGYFYKLGNKPVLRWDAEIAQEWLHPVCLAFRNLRSVIMRHTKCMANRRSLLTLVVFLCHPASGSHSFISLPSLNEVQMMKLILFHATMLLLKFFLIANLKRIITCSMMKTFDFQQRIRWCQFAHPTILVLS